MRQMYANAQEEIPMTNTYSGLSDEALFRLAARIKRLGQPASTMFIAEFARRGLIYPNDQ